MENFLGIFLKKLIFIIEGGYALNIEKGNVDIPYLIIYRGGGRG